MIESIHAELIKMYFYVVLTIGFIPFVLCGAEENVTFSQDDFKCSLPDVKSIDDNLDITRFRTDFSKISEVKFPGLIGPLNERLICKIKCIDGNWVGPLCSSTPDGRFQPILRECMYRNDHPLLAISFKNSSIDKETPFPHGSVIIARCLHFGLYKLKGDNTLRCENGEWIPKMPECVPTTVVTNFTGDAPPTIQYTVVRGSAAVQPSGELYVFPDSSLRLECISPRALGDPEWSWTSALGHHTAEWSPDDGEQQTHYRLSLSKATARHGDRYTCAAPSGHTNTVHLKVVNAVCPPLEVGLHVLAHAQGLRLGHTAHFSCQTGHHLRGASLLTCMGDGRWSGPAPSCVETACPPLRAGPRLNALEYSARAGGRAVFACAWGYRLVGEPGVECGADGRWTGPAPTCAPIYCPEPAVPSQGRLLTPKQGQYLVGDLVSFSCLPGYHLAGEASIVCTEAGYWSHPPPFCGPSAARAHDTILVDNATLHHLED